MVRYHTQMNSRVPSSPSRYWDLDPDAVFLNHGSFGACPRAILERQTELRRQLERQPVDFFVRRYYAMMDSARQEVASFLGADPEGDPHPHRAVRAGVEAVTRDIARDRLTCEGQRVVAVLHQDSVAIHEVADLAAESQRVHRFRARIHELGRLLGALSVTRSQRIHP